VRHACIGCMSPVVAHDECGPSLSAQMRLRLHCPCMRAVPCQELHERKGGVEQRLQPLCVPGRGRSARARQVQDALRERAQPLDLLCVAARGRPRGAGGPGPDPLPALPDLARLPGVHAWAPQRLQHSLRQRPAAALPDLAACLLRTGAAALFPGAEQAAEQTAAAARAGEARGQGGAPGAAGGEAAVAGQQGGPAARRAAPDQPTGTRTGPGARPAGAHAAHEDGVPAGVLAAVHEWLGAQACAFAGASGPLTEPDMVTA